MAKDYGLRISLTGNDAKTASDQNLAFTSKYPLFRILFTGNLVLTVGSAPSGTESRIASVGFNHNLTYIPFFQVYGWNDLDSGTSKIAFDYGFASGGVLLFTARCRTGFNVLQIREQNNDTVSHTGTAFYFIYADPGS